MIAAVQLMAKRRELEAREGKLAGAEVAAAEHEKAAARRGAELSAALAVSAANAGEIAAAA